MRAGLGSRLAERHGGLVVVKVPNFAAGRRRAIGFTAGLLIAVLVLGSGVALASIPSTSSGAFTGCVNKTGGAVRIIDYQAGKRCAADENSVSWSQGYRY